LSALPEAVQELVSDFNELADSIIGMGIDATAVALVPSDQNGITQQNAILWMDKRAHAETDEINETAYQGLAFTGGSVSPEWALPKIMWLKRNRPEVYNSAVYLVDLVDWLIFQFTGTWSSSLCNLITEWTMFLS
jgi:ribulose kinase